MAFIIRRWLGEISLLLHLFVCVLPHWQVNMNGLGLHV